MARPLLIATYNIDFQSIFFGKRFDRLFNTINNTSCNIIAFQEVPVAHIDPIVCLLQTKYPYHITSHTPGNIKRPYTEMIFSKSPFIVTGIHKFTETVYDRALLWGTIDYEGNSVTIATSHLESMDYNGTTRLKQAHEVHQILSDKCNVLFLGDFNTEETDELGPITQYWKECPNYSNTWFLQRLYPDKDDIRKRYDRVFTSPIWTLPRLAKITTPLIGQYLPEEGVWTSDHDGLLVLI